MFWTAVFVSLPVLLSIATGFYLEAIPTKARALPPRRLKVFLTLNITLFGVGLLLFLLLLAQNVFAVPQEGGTAAREISLGMGLAFIGIGLSTGLATIAAAFAVGPIGAAALAVIAEKPEAFGRSLIFIGLAEGIAIYGLVISILLLDKL